MNCVLRSSSVSQSLNYNLKQSALELGSKDRYLTHNPQIIMTSKTLRAYIKPVVFTFIFNL